MNITSCQNNSIIKTLFNVPSKIGKFTFTALFFLALLVIMHASSPTFKQGLGKFVNLGPIGKVKIATLLYSFYGVALLISITIEHGLLKNRKFQKEKVTSQETIKSLTSEKTSIKEKNDEIENTLKELRRQVDTLQTKLTELEYTRDTLEAEFSKKETEANECLRTQLATQALTLEKAQKSYEESQAELRKKATRIVELQSELREESLGKEKETEIFDTALQNKYDLQTKELETLQETIKSLTSEKTSLQEKHDQIENTLTELRRKVDTLQAKLTELEWTRDTLEAELSKKETEANECRTQLATQALTLEKAQKSYEESQAELREKATRIVELQTQFGEESLEKEKETEIFDKALQNKYDLQSKELETLQNACLEQSERMFVSLQAQLNQKDQHIAYLKLTVQALDNNNEVDDSDPDTYYERIDTETESDIDDTQVIDHKTHLYMCDSDSDNESGDSKLGTIFTKEMLETEEQERKKAAEAPKNNIADEENGGFKIEAPQHEETPSTIPNENSSPLPTLKLKNNRNANSTLTSLENGHASSRGHDRVLHRARSLYSGVTPRAPTLQTTKKTTPRTSEQLLGKAQPPPPSAPKPRNLRIQPNQDGSFHPGTIRVGHTIRLNTPTPSTPSDNGEVLFLEPVNTRRQIAN